MSQVVDQRLSWDVANNLIALLDDRDANEWPLGHRPQSVHIAHDVNAEYDYTDDTGRRTPEDEGTDWRDELGRTRANDPMRTEPAEMLPDLPPGRVASQTWEYDWLSNMVDATDDASAFYERSPGDLENGADFATGLGAAPALRPSALYVSTGLDAASVSAGEGGWLELDYGTSGNVVAMTVHAECAQRVAATACAPVLGGDPAATRQQLRDGCVCGMEQHYRYGWDELNRLVRARRYEREGGAGDWTLGARLRYRYDGANQRTVKEVQTGTAATGPASERVALYVFPGDYERRGLQHGAGFASGTYVAPGAALSESQYLVGGARVVWKPGDPALGLDRDHRITFNTSDLLGTTTAVIDLVTGELTECSTYYPGGARETYLTTTDAELQPEPMGFTGKEGDEEVGLVYFGERYLIPRIARWASPDPLAIHALGGGETMNSYHYVAGNLLQARDPEGLDFDVEFEPVQLLDSSSGENPVVVNATQATIRATVKVAVVPQPGESDEALAQRRHQAAADIRASLNDTYNNVTKVISISGETYVVRFDISVEETTDVLTEPEATARFSGTNVNYILIPDAQSAHGATRMRGPSAMPGVSVPLPGLALDGLGPARNDSSRIGRYSSVGRIDIGYTAAHEVGHQLGLDERYMVSQSGVVSPDAPEVRSNIMASFGGSDLSSDQVNAMVQRGLRAMRAFPANMARVGGVGAVVEGWPVRMPGQVNPRWTERR
ncbi:MAG: hypothetical protein GXP55_26585 [Deltaproteobacteria bacterium]|nr:hypothetical protein [Deltaproteobacteria bacterium]